MKFPCCVALDHREWRSTCAKKPEIALINARSTIEIAHLPRPILEFQNRTVRFINSSFNTYVFQKLWSLFRKILWTIYKKNKINYVSFPCFSLILPLWGTESISKKRIRFGKIQNRVLGTITKFFIRRDVRIAVVILQRNDVRHAGNSFLVLKNLISIDYCKEKQG